MAYSVENLTLADIPDDTLRRAKLTLMSDTWSDQQIVKAFIRAPVDSLPGAAIPLGSKSVSRLRKICPDTVVKVVGVASSLPHREALAQEFVCQNTSILTPRVSRSFTYKSSTYVVMEYIAGRQLCEVWDQLSAETQQSVASRLRNYIQELRVASRKDDRSSVPGPLGLTPQRVRGPTWFTIQTRGPFNTYDELIRYSLKVFPEKAQRLEKREGLVLTHGDLNMRNILWGDDRQLWVLDWENAGFYPPFFEGIGMLRSHNDDSPGLEKWFQLVPRITGDGDG